jgi:putative transposase
MPLEVYQIMRMVVTKDFNSNQRAPGSLVISNVAAAIDKANVDREASGLKLLDYPSDRSVYREIESLDPYEVAVQRYGKAKANAKFGLVESGLLVRFPLERIEIDEWQIDVRNLAIDSGRARGLTAKQLRALERTRRWAVVAIDCATRCILGLVITDKPSREATLKVIDQITFDKTQIALDYGCKFPWPQYGRPGLIVMDNGSAFTPIRIRQAISAIGSDVMYAPAGVPKLRGRIERFFGTTTRGAMPELPGRVFANPQERGDYDSDAMACLTDDELTSILIRYVNDVYHQTGHEGLKEETPADCWDRLAARYPVDQGVDGYQRREAFGRSVFRKITGRGITVFGIEYSSALVRHLRLHSHVNEVEVRVDPRDLGWITMWHEGEWHPLTAKLDYLNGVHLCEWLAAEKALKANRRAKNRVTARMVREALEGIRETVSGARLRSNIGPSSLTAQQIAGALKEAYLGINIPDQDKDGTGTSTAQPIGITDDDWEDDHSDSDENGALRDAESDQDENNDDDTTEITK